MSAASSNAQSDSSADTGSDNLPIEELKRQQKERYQRRIADHDAEARDTRWASRAETSFGEGLEELRKRVPMEIERVDCRTTSCTAVIRWNSYQNAVTTAHYIADNPGYKLNCAKEILLPDPADPAQTYEATALFDCTEARVAEFQ